MAAKLLERETHLRELNTVLKESIDGEGHIALISGEAGIGKTSLVEQFLQQLRYSVRVLWGACDSLFTPRPLGPLHDMAMLSKGELLELLNKDADRQSIFSSFFVKLQSSPTIAVFEDIHWADEATLDLIKFLGRRIHRTASLIILTYRADELGTGHPLRLLLGDLPRLSTLRLDLLPLSKTSVFALAHAADQDERANELFEITSGNPFFVSEILDSQGEGMPATVRDAVLTRAARLSSPARAVLEAAAVIGIRVEPWLLSHITGNQLAHVDECIAGGLLQAQGDYYVFRHELTRQTILKTILPGRKVTLHRILLTTLKDSPLTRDDLARLANHAEGTKDVSAVLEYAPAAARQASATGSHREAIVLYELALQYADSLAPALYGQMLEDYTNELWFANRLSESTIFLNKAIELWHSIGDRLREGNNLVSLAQASHSLGRKADAEQASRSAIAILEALPPSEDLARAYKAQCFIRMEDRDCAEAVVWGEKAITLAERFGDSDTLARSYNYMGCAMMLIDFERGREFMERSLTIGREANLPFAISGTLTNTVQMFVELFQFEAAEPYLIEGLAYATEQYDDYHLHILLVIQASANLYQGDWRKAYATVLMLQQRTNLIFYIYNFALIILGRLQVRQGDPAALATLDEALGLSAQIDTIVFLGSSRAARAERAWLTGQDDLAQEEARAVYDLAVSKTHPWLAGELAFWRWRTGDAFTPPAWIAKPYALHMAGDWRGAADEWERLGCPYEQALALMDGDAGAKLEALEIFERLGAQPAAQKLKQILRSLGMHGIPRGPRAARRANPFGLTSREMEVLACLVGGSRNKDIAKQLSLSTRTVEHHIASILLKMQVQSRYEAVALAEEQISFSSE